MDFGEQVVVADLEAGIGTLTRLGDNGVDAALVVVEPTTKSLEVGVRALSLIREKHIDRVIVVANRIRGEDDLARVRAAFPDVDVRSIPDDPAIVQAERHGTAPLDSAPDAPAVRALVDLGEDLLAPVG